MASMKDHNAHMMQHGERFAMRAAWDRASATYLQRRGNDVSTVSYGNLAPTEDEVGLLGDLRGQRVLDVGCGGGQNAVACVLVGAEVVGVDISDVQLAAARKLAEAHGVTVEWQQGDSLNIDLAADAFFDRILAIQVLPYVDDPAAVLRLAAARLRPGGRMVVSIDHPVRNCFYDTEMEELISYPVRAYADESPLPWNFAAGMPMLMRHHPLGVWLGWMAAAGFVVQRLVEASAPREVCDELWPEDSPLAPLRNIPHTAIFVADLAK